MKTDIIQIQKQDALDEIISHASNSNDPVSFARDVSETLLTHGLITEALYDILMGNN